jgi:hypothetical protein
VGNLLAGNVSVGNVVAGTVSANNALSGDVSGNTARFSCPQDANTHISNKKQIYLNFDPI